MSSDPNTTTSPRRHTVIISDVHLSQSHPVDEGDPLWMRYRRATYHPDRDFEGLIDCLLARTQGDASDLFELVCNGDVFDFDAPWVEHGESTAREYPTDGPGCAEQLGRILDDHPRFVGALTKLLEAGHYLLFISGNHDLELYFPEVRALLRERLAARLTQRGLDVEDARQRARDHVRFRTWLHRTDDGIYLEHGSQYDMINGLPDPMRPLTKDGRVLPVCGKLAFKRLGAQMGYFNPYCEDTFYMGGLGYIRHFIADYLFSHRHIARTWAKGSLKSSWEIFRARAGRYAELDDKSVREAAAESNIDEARVRATHALRVLPAEARFIPVLRELWLDRVGFVTLALVVLVCTALTGQWTLVGEVAIVLAVVFAIYEVATPKPDVRTYDSAPDEVTQLYDIHDARAICFGHTHRPCGEWRDGRFWGNSGTWCPAFYDRECTKPVLSRRPFLWLTSDNGDAKTLRGGLFWYAHGEVTEGAAHNDAARSAVTTHATADHAATATVSR